MTWKQKLLTGLMTAGFALRWLAGRSASEDAALLQKVAQAIDRAVGWALAVGLIVLAGMALSRVHQRFTRTGTGHD